MCGICGFVGTGSKSTLVNMMEKMIHRGPDDKGVYFNNNDQNALENILDSNLKTVSKIPELKAKINIFKDNFPKIINFVKNFN